MVDRWRIPHAVPLGGIFTWSIEGLIFSMIFAVVSMQNAILYPFYVILVVSYITTILSHLSIATLYNKPDQAEMVGKLHSAISDAQCSIVFSIASTHISLTLDTCLIYRDACPYIFPEFPISTILIPCTSILAVVLLLVAIALSFVSCPQDRKCYLFVSNAGIAMATCLQSFAVPVLVSKLSTCSGSSIPGIIFLVSSCIFVLLGLVIDFVEEENWILEVVYAVICTCIPVTAMFLFRKITWGIVASFVLCIMCSWIPVGSKHVLPLVFGYDALVDENPKPKHESGPKHEHKEQPSKPEKKHKTLLQPPSQVTFMSDNHTKAYSQKKKMDDENIPEHRTRELSEIFAADEVRQSILRNRTSK